MRLIECNRTWTYPIPTGRSTPRWLKDGSVCGIEGLLTPLRTNHMTLQTTTWLRKFKCTILLTIPHVQDKSTETHQSMLQSSHLMTSRLSSEATNHDIPFQLNNQPTCKTHFINHIFSDDDNTRTFHEFEMRIGMNESDHSIIVLLKQQRERPQRGFEPWRLRCRCSALPVELSGQLGAGR